MSFSVNSDFGSFNRPNPAQMKAQIDSQLKSAGATDEEISNISGPQDVETLASKYGVSLPQPPQPPTQDGSIFNQQNSTTGNGDSIFGGVNISNRPNPEEMKNTIDSNLLSAGATSAEIEEAATQGPEGIQELAEKYNVSLPQPPQGQEEIESDESRQDPEQMKAEIDSQLKAAGATDEELSNISGPQDLQTLASKYGVELPQPPQGKRNHKMNSNQGNSSSSFDITSLVQMLSQALQSFGININQ